MAITVEQVAIELGADTAGIETGVLRGVKSIERLEKAGDNATSDLKTSFADLQRRVDAFSTEARTAARSTGSLSNTTGRANQVMLDFGAGLGDAAFGIRGVANNIPQVLTGFQRLQKDAGSTLGAIKSLGSTLTGFGGLILATQLIPMIDLAVRKFGLFGQATKEAREEAEEAAEEISELAGQVLNLQRGLPSVNVPDQLLETAANLKQERLETLEADQQRLKSLRQFVSLQGTSVKRAVLMEELGIRTADEARREIQALEANEEQRKQQISLLTEQVSLLEERQRKLELAAQEQQRMNAAIEPYKEGIDAANQSLIEMGRRLQTTREEALRLGGAVDSMADLDLAEAPDLVVFEELIPRVGGAGPTKQDMEDMKKAADRGVANMMKQMQRYEKRLKKSADTTKKLGKTLAVGFVGQIGRAVGEAVVQVRTLEDALSSVGRIAKSVIGNFVGLAAQAGLTSLLPGTGGFLKTFRGLIGLQHGGIVTRPTAAVIGEGSEPEAVVPLSRLDRMIQGGRQRVHLTGTFRVEGQDLELALDRVINLNAT